MSITLLEDRTSDTLVSAVSPSPQFTDRRPSSGLAARPCRSPRTRRGQTVNPVEITLLENEAAARSGVTAAVVTHHSPRAALWRLPPRRNGRLETGR
jgi:hypothetical protein